MNIPTLASSVTMSSALEVEFVLLNLVLTSFSTILGCQPSYQLFTVRVELSAVSCSLSKWRCQPANCQLYTDVSSSPSVE